ncbi:hypothetical protein NPS01_31910 [Nocardioides psychrotolerans]|uniref:PKD domain-containing protein n=1 Tax=Nocardioides psychrotolerans TaxID=1005945 RepID=A0A1I3MK09_9ACTN|nr:hypothetical protein [Nocardioides psychrotolerans]GEP39528.1 hypothetical protein NPS01_31910 [Nocardioides psychrotolerans]SFI97251.1 hypothetical protein SAMN05216561_115120 [Nocardioides psychrotolerans]
MIVRLAIFVGLVMTFLVADARPAAAGCQLIEHVTYVQGSVQVNSHEVCSPQASQGASSAPSVTVPNIEDEVCISIAAALDLTYMPYCFLGGGDQAVPAQVTPGLVSAALRRIPLPASVLVVQPPNGRTLVNFATNFYTDTQELTRTITLLGQRVDLRITPASYGWRFGDGESASTTTPGAAYPDLQVTHDYLSAGGVAPAVDTTYTADFRVNAGAWRPVPGTVTIPGATMPLEVVEATPTLVGYR